MGTSAWAGVKTFLLYSDDAQDLVSQMLTESANQVPSFLLKNNLEVKRNLEFEKLSLIFPAITNIGQTLEDQMPVLFCEKDFKTEETPGFSSDKG